MRDPFSNYDQWKTSSPFDECPDDTHCFFCGHTLTFGVDDDGTGPEYDGFCSEACQKDHEQKQERPICIRPIIDLLSFNFGSKNPKGWSKLLYKSTECGAWMNFPECNQVQVGSIVEGVDQYAETKTLTWPFTREDFWSAVEEVEQECRGIWNDTHGCEECAERHGFIDPQSGMEISGCDGMTPVHPDCKECEGKGVSI